MSVFMALFIWSCGRNTTASSQLPDGIISRAVKHAKEKGIRTTTITVADADATRWFMESSLEDVLLSNFLIMAEATGRAQPKPLTDYVITFHGLRTLETISKPELSDGKCDEPLPQGVSVGPDELVVPLLQGSVEIEGVMVTMRGGPELSFVNKKRYLLIGRRCRSAQFLLTVGSAGVFEVDEDKRIRSTRRTDLPLYTKELLALETLEKVRERVQNLNQTRRSIAR